MNFGTTGTVVAQFPPPESASHCVAQSSSIIIIIITQSWQKPNLYCLPTQLTTDQLSGETPHLTSLPKWLAAGKARQAPAAFRWA